MQTENRPPLTPAQKMRNYRQRMREAGYKQIQLWVPDVNNPEFIKEVQEQSRRIAANEAAEKEILDWIETAYDDSGWTYPDP